MTEKNIIITKASGEQNIFSADKLRKSLTRSGASKEVVDKIVNRITESLYDGMPTGEIYRDAFRMLRHAKAGPAARYKLKNAIKELGPTGFPFEQFIARLFKGMGYSVTTGNMIRGRCITHEVDVVAKKDKEQHLIECKFHQLKGTFCDVKVPLYISARFEDIAQQTGNGLNNAFQGWLITNTRFTKDALSFGLCAGLNLTGWDFPEKESLKVLIDKHHLYPITSLTTLTKQEKQQLLERDIVLCQELNEHPDYLKNIVSMQRLEKVREECGQLLDLVC